MSRGPEPESPRHRTAAAIRLDAPLDRGAYAAIGFGLMAVKYLVEAGLGDYGVGLFMGTPLLGGTIAAWLYNRPVRRGLGASLLVAQLAILLCAAFLLRFAPGRPASLGLPLLMGAERICRPVPTYEVRTAARGSKAARGTSTRSIRRPLGPSGPTSSTRSIAACSTTSSG